LRPGPTIKCRWDPDQRSRALRHELCVRERPIPRRAVRRVRAPALACPHGQRRGLRGRDSTLLPCEPHLDLGSARPVPTLGEVVPFWVLAFGDVRRARSVRCALDRQVHPFQPLLLEDRPGRAVRLMPWRAARGTSEMTGAVGMGQCQRRSQALKVARDQPEHRRRPRHRHLADRLAEAGSTGCSASRNARSTPARSVRSRLGCRFGPDSVASAIRLEGTGRWWSPGWPDRHQPGAGARL
jgi:hypothetical protein